MKRNFAALLLAILLMSTLSGCYFKREVSGQEVGLIMDDGVSISSVVGPGRYTKLSFYADLVRVDTSTKTIIWQDNDVWTKDKQVVTFGVSVSYARATDSDSVSGMWSTYNAEARDDEALERLVKSRIPRVVKQVATTYTLDQMLGSDETSDKNRDTLQREIQELLEEELGKSYILLVDFGVNNVGADEVYMQKLKEKSTAAIDIELAKEKTKQLEEQVKQEEAETQVALEVARRKNQVAEEEARVYETSPEAYELERLRILQDVIKDGDKVYFIPEGMDISLYLTGDQAGTPIIRE